PADPPARFVSAANGVGDRTAQQFRMSASATGTYLRGDDLGAVSLAPAAGAEFDDSSLPATWTDSAEAAGGSPAVARGGLVLGGGGAGTTPLLGPDRSLVCGAPSAGSGIQWAGLAAGTPTDPWAGFGLQNGTLYAAVSTGRMQTIQLPAGLVGTAHVYRIDWTGRGFSFSVDGLLVGSKSASVTSMRPTARDATTDGTPLVIDWVRLSGYASAGSFVSRVLDAQQMVTWDRLSYRADIPAGTSLQISVRTGSTRTPDATWSAWTAVGQGGRVDASSRYIQYRVDLSTAAPGSTPVLHGVGITNNAMPLESPREY